MSLFQAGPYRSKVLGSVVRQSHRWLDQVSVGLRSLKVSLNWTAQILVYPIYVAFQTIRVAGAKLRQAIELGAETAQPAPATPLAESVPPPSSIAALTSDTPLAQVLVAVQKLTLSIDVPIEVSTLPSPQALAAAVPLHRMAAPGDLAATRTIAAAALEPQGIIFVRGIATSLETRSLVLVTNQNQILNILTAEQQAQLRQRIIWEVATFGRSLKSRQATQQRFARLHLPDPDPLLQAAKQTWRRIKGWFQFEHAPAALPLESPIHQALAVVQRFTLPEDLPILLPQAGGLVKSGDPLCGLAVSLSQSALPAPVAVDSPSIAPLSRVMGEAVRSTREVIRGVATLLETKALVLVTNHNAILDVLTAEQQMQIRQKITWEVAHYGRYLQIRQTTQRALARLHPATEDSPVLPPVRAFQKLMAWVQSGSVAIAANLFRESTLVAPSSSLDVTLLSRSPSAPAASIGMVFPWLTSPLQLSGATAAGTLSLEPVAPLSIPSRPIPATPALSQPVRPTHPAASNRKPSALHLTAKQAIAAPAAPLTRTAAQHHYQPVATPDYIDTQATPLGYIQPFWEKLLRWLDRLFCFLETQFVVLWDWFWQQVSKR